MSSTGQENAAYQRTEAEEGGGGGESNKTEDAVTENKEEEETEYSEYTTDRDSVKGKINIIKTSDA